MASFGANIIKTRGFNPTFKIQGQIHHRAGALLPAVNADNKFLQIYFLGNSDDEINRRYIIIFEQDEVRRVSYFFNIKFKLTAGL